MTALAGRRPPTARRTRRLVGLLLAAALLATFLYWQRGADVPRRLRPQTPVRAPSHAPAPGGAGPAAALVDLRALRVAPEWRCSAYDRADYPYRQSVEAVVIAELGGVYGPYTGRRYADRYATDIEHMVALSEAHDSGLCAADDRTRRAFAGDPLNLTLASPTVNREVKRHYDAGEWLPPRNACWFAGRVVAVRKKYGLTVDQAERNALAAVLSRCSSLLLERR